MKILKKILPLIILFTWWLSPEAIRAQNTNWEAPEEADTLENPLDKTEQIVTAGRQIFQQLCAVCHGKSGEGDGAASSTLDPKPANLLDSLIQHQSEGAMFWKINEGRSPMPSYENQLSDKQVWALVTYIQSLNKDTSN